MDAQTIKTVADLLSSGGSAALMLVVYIGFQVLHSSREAARHVKEIHRAVQGEVPKLSEHVRVIREDMEALKRNTDKMDIRLAAALAIRPSQENRR